MRNLCQSSVAALAFFVFAASTAAADYPTRPIQVIVPTPPAGAIDLLTRALSEPLRKRLDTPIVIVNRAGAGGLVGAQMAKRAPSDGYTLLTHVDSLLAFSTFVKTDVQGEDFTPIAKFAENPYFFVTSAKLTVKTLPEFVAYAKANPGKINFGVLTNSHPYLQALKFLSATGIQAATIPYSGGAPVHTALLADEIQAYLGSPLSFIESVRAGRIHALALGGTKSLASFPNLPLANTYGYPVDVEGWSTWFGLFGPAGLPNDIVRKLSAAIVEIARTPEFEAQTRQIGSEPAPLGWQEFGVVTARSLAEIQSAARDAKLPPPQ